MHQQPNFVSKRHLAAMLVGSALVAGLIATGGCSSSGGGSTSALGKSAGGSGNSGGLTGTSGSAGTTNLPIEIPVRVTALVSDRPGQGAAHVDPNLVNPWGLAINPNPPAGPLFWTADNGTGVATVYDAQGNPQPLVVTIPPAPGQTGPSAPTGQVWNSVPSSFLGDAFIFASEDGVISGWQPSAGTSAIVRVDRSQSGALYKGLAIVRSRNPDLLLATNFRNGTVDVWDANYRPVIRSGAFVDPQMPAGFAPFNVASFGGQVYVTYAKQDENKEDDVKGAGNGRIDVFNPDGTFVKTLVDGGALNSPWGMATASTAQLGNVLVVGNFGDGTIHAYDIDTGKLLAQMADQTGKPLVIDGLWSLEFVPPKNVVVVPPPGNAGAGGAVVIPGTGGAVAAGGAGGTVGAGGAGVAGSDAGVDGGEADGGEAGTSTPRALVSPPLYFTAGPDDEAHGLFGRIDLAL